MRTEHRMVELDRLTVRQILGDAGWAAMQAAYARASAYLAQSPRLIFAQAEYRGWLNPERRTVVTEADGDVYGLHRYEPHEIWLGIDAPRGVNLPEPVANLWHELAHAFEAQWGLPADRNEGRCSERAKRWEAMPPTDAELAAFGAELARPAAAPALPNRLKPAWPPPDPVPLGPNRLKPWPLAQRGIWKGVPYTEVRSIGGLGYRGVEFYEVVGTDGFIRPIVVQKAG